jgi:hypothetical protein
MKPGLAEALASAEKWLLRWFGRLIYDPADFRLQGYPRFGRADIPS